MSGAKSEQNKQDAEKWSALEKKSKKIRKALQEFSTAIADLSKAATGDKLLLSKIDDINDLSNLPIEGLVNNFSDVLLKKNLPSLSVQFLENTASIFAKDGDEIARARAYVTAAQTLFDEAAAFNKVMQELSKNDKIASQQEEFHQTYFAGLKTKIQQVRGALLTSNESGITPVGTFAKVCARFGAALVALPLMLAGVVVSAVGYVVSPATYAAGIIIGAGAAFVMEDPNPIVDLVGSSVIMVGQLMSIAGKAAGKYSLSGDNADFGEELYDLGIEDWVDRGPPRK